MPRSRQRVCLQDGLKLDLNWLARNGFVQFGANTGFREIRWTHSYWGEIANGLITADMSDPADAWLRVEIGNLVQRISKAPLRSMAELSWPRNFDCLVELARKAKSETARIAAIRELLDRGYGRP